MNPTPREVNDVAIVTTGVIIWIAALVVAWIIGASGRTLGVCAAGIALGIWGLRYVRRRRARISG